MQLNLYSEKGAKLSKKITLDDFIFKSKINDYLLGLALYVYLKNQRQATAHAKTRGEVRGGGVKPWRQKGTGRARAGSIRSPIWKGGGVVFGPRTERNYKRKLSRKMRKAAVRSALSLFAKEGKLVVLEKADIKDKKMTQQVKALAEKLAGKEKALFVQSGKEKNLYLGSRNLKDVDVVSVNELNVYGLLSSANLVILKDALDVINSFWGVEGEKKVEGKKSSPKASQPLAGKVKGKKVENGVKDKKERESGLHGLELSTRVVKSLEKAGIKGKDELAAVIKKGEKIEGVGIKSLDDIKKVLKIK